MVLAEEKYDSAIKKNEILPSATAWMDIEGIILSEMSDRRTPMPYDFTYIRITKKQNKQKYFKSRLIDTENILMFVRWEES